MGSIRAHTSRHPPASQFPDGRKQSGSQQYVLILWRATEIGGEKRGNVQLESKAEGENKLLLILLRFTGNDQLLAVHLTLSTDLGRNNISSAGCQIKFDYNQASGTAVSPSFRGRNSWLGLNLIANSLLTSSTHPRDLPLGNISLFLLASLQSIHPSILFRQHYRTS